MGHESFDSAPLPFDALFSNRSRVLTRWVTSCPLRALSSICRTALGNASPRLI
jgi:hypothetical protein